MLTKFKSEQCDKIICCGDIVGIGPEPEKTVRTVMQIENLIAVKGNHDRYFVEGMPTIEPNDEHMSLGEMEHHKWEHNLLTEKSFDFIKSLPYVANIEVEKVKIKIVHYAMDAGNKYSAFIGNPTIDDCYKLFADVDSDIVVYGHDHKPSFNTDGKRMFINCGSLGCPSKDINVARGGILRIVDGKAHYDSVRLEYDVNRVIDKINDLNYPESDIIKTVFFGIK